MSRRFQSFAVAALACVVMGVLLVVAPAATASPSTVDYVVTTIGSSISAGSWSTAGANIDSLDRTIRNELEVNRNPVSVASNPPQERLDAVNQRLQLIKADYKRLYDAMERIDRASVRQVRRLLAEVRLELLQKLNLINARGVIDALDALDADAADEISSTVKRLRTQNGAVKYLSGLMADLKPAIREAQGQRASLVPLANRYAQVLASYGITVGGPAVQPSSAPTPTTGHPQIGGTWVEGSAGGCPGAVITIVQSAGGEVTALSDNVTSCNGAWVGSGFTWVSANVLEFAYTVTQNPGHWVASGRYSITFSSDGRTANGMWIVPGSTGPVDWYKQG